MELRRSKRLAPGSGSDDSEEEGFRNRNIQRTNRLVDFSGDGRDVTRGTAPLNTFSSGGSAPEGMLLSDILACENISGSSSQRSQNLISAALTLQSQDERALDQNPMITIPPPGRIVPLGTIQDLGGGGVSLESSNDASRFGPIQSQTIPPHDRIFPPGNVQVHEGGGVRDVESSGQSMVPIIPSHDRIIPSGNVQDRCDGGIVYPQSIDQSSRPLIDSRGGQAFMRNYVGNSSELNNVDDGNALRERARKMGEDMVAIRPPQNMQRNANASARSIPGSALPQQDGREFDTRLDAGSGLVPSLIRETQAAIPVSQGTGELQTRTRFTQNVSDVPGRGQRLDSNTIYAPLVMQPLPNNTQMAANSYGLGGAASWQDTAQYSDYQTPSRRQNGGNLREAREGDHISRQSNIMSPMSTGEFNLDALMSHQKGPGTCGWGSDRDSLHRESMVRQSLQNQADHFFATCYASDESRPRQGLTLDPHRARIIQFRMEEQQRASAPVLVAKPTEIQFVQWVTNFINHLKLLKYFALEYLLLPFPSKLFEFTNSDLIQVIYQVIWGKLEQSLASNPASLRVFVDVEPLDCFTVWKRLHKEYLPTTGPAGQRRLHMFNSLVQAEPEPNAAFLERVQQFVKLFEYVRQPLHQQAVMHKICTGLKRAEDRVHAMDKSDDDRYVNDIQMWYAYVERLELMATLRVQSALTSQSANTFPSPGRQENTRGEAPRYARRCFSCGETGHIASECRQHNSGKVVSLTCSFCHQRGHTVHECRHPNKGFHQARSPERTMAPIICNYCRKEDHTISDCNHPGKRNVATSGGANVVNSIAPSGVNTLAASPATPQRSHSKNHYGPGSQNTAFRPQYKTPAARAPTISRNTANMAVLSGYDEIPSENHDSHPIPDVIINAIHLEWSGLDMYEFLVECGFAVGSRFVGEQVSTIMCAASENEIGMSWHAKFHNQRNRMIRVAMGVKDFIVSLVEILVSEGPLFLHNWASLRRAYMQALFWPHQLIDDNGVHDYFWWRLFRYRKLSLHSITLSSFLGLESQELMTAWVALWRVLKQFLQAIYQYSHGTMVSVSSWLPRVPYRLVRSINW